MGKSTTTTYRVAIFVPGFAYTPQGWDCKRYGRPTEASLAQWVRDFEAATEPGGVNAHLGATTIRRARVIRQSTDVEVASYSAAPAPFQAIRRVA